MYAHKESLSFTLCALAGLVGLSYVQNILTLLLPIQTLKPILIDTLLISAILVGISQGAPFKTFSRSVNTYHLIFLISFIFITTATATSMVSQSFASIDIFRELRIALYFILISIVLASSTNLSRTSFETLFITLAAGATLGNLIYIATTYFLFVIEPEHGHEIRLLNGEAARHAFAPGMELKYKYAPHMIALLQYLTLLKVFCAQRRAIWVIFCLLLSITVIFSNMRSVVGAYFLATLSALFFYGIHLLTSTESRAQKIQNIRWGLYTLFVVGLIAAISIGIFKVNPRFDEQITNKTLNPDPTDARLETFYDLFNIQHLDSIPKAIGMGSVFSWDKISTKTNPMDSGLLNLILTYGYLFTILYATTLFTIFFGLLWRLSKTPKNDLNFLFMGALSISLFIFIFNHYNDSHFATLSDSVFGALITGASAYFAFNRKDVRE